MSCESICLLNSTQSDSLQYSCFNCNSGKGWITQRSSRCTPIYREKNASKNETGGLGVMIDPLTIQYWLAPVECFKLETTSVEFVRRFCLLEAH